MARKQRDNRGHASEVGRLARATATANLVAQVAELEASTYMLSVLLALGAGKVTEGEAAKLLAISRAEVNSMREFVVAKISADLNKEVLDMYAKEV